jgi:riboflavin kinase/FMN adenylyltransferase
MNPTRDARFVLRGVVEHGDERGRTIGFPTANLAVEQLPALDGVWAGWLDLRGERQVAAISIGVRPTFYGVDGFRLLEAHILDFTGDCYDEVVTVWMSQRLRGQVRFASVDALIEQLQQDVEQTRRWTAGAKIELPSAVRDLHSIPFGRAVPVSAAA